MWRWMLLLRDGSEGGCGGRLEGTRFFHAPVALIGSIGYSDRLSATSLPLLQLAKAKPMNAVCLIGPSTLRVAPSLVLPIVAR
jgi:hypothetical protein